MAGKISELTETTTPNASMQFEVNDGGTSKRITHANIFNGVASADINGGTIDGTVIGDSTPTTGRFTTLTIGGSIGGIIKLATGAGVIQSGSDPLLTISSKIITLSGTTGITASTTQTQGNGLLSASYNVVSTVANTNDVVTLPIAVAGTIVFILNLGANTLQVFPSNGDAIGAGGANNSTTQTTKTGKLYIAGDDTTWIVF